MQHALLLHHHAHLPVCLPTCLPAHLLAPLLLAGWPALACRGGSSSTLRFGGTVHHHPLLASINLRHALTGVPGLASQTFIPASAVHSMQVSAPACLPACPTACLQPLLQPSAAILQAFTWLSTMKCHVMPLVLADLAAQLPAVPARLPALPYCSALLQLDPCDPWRLAFHLGCGWSGVLHLHSSTITHLHAPAHAFYAEEPPGGAGLAGADEGAATASVAQMLLWASTAAPGAGQYGGKASEAYSARSPP